MCETKHKGNAVSETFEEADLLKDKWLQEVNFNKIVTR